MPCNGPGPDINMTQWRQLGPGNAWLYDYGVEETFRHVDKCNLLWLDGHVTFVIGGPEDPGNNISARWFDPLKTDEDW